MAHAKLTKTEATKAWVLRAKGCKLRDIQRRFDVDPRRLYDVWEEKCFRGTRLKAMRIFKRMFPGTSVADRFEIHVPKFRRELKSPNEPRLPGI